MTHTKKSSELSEKFWELQRQERSKKISHVEYCEGMKHLFDSSMSYIDELESKLRNIKGACGDIEFK